jgi:hypothetical protein
MMQKDNDSDDVRKAKALLEKEGILWDESVKLIGDLRVETPTADGTWPCIYEHDEVRNLTAKENDILVQELTETYDRWSKSYRFFEPTASGSSAGGRTAWAVNMAQRIGSDFNETIKLRYAVRNSPDGDPRVKVFRDCLAWARVAKHITTPVLYDESAGAALENFGEWVKEVASKLSKNEGVVNDAAIWSLVQEPVWKLLLRNIENLTDYDLAESVRATMRANNGRLRVVRYRSVLDRLHPKNYPNLGYIEIKAE